MTQDQIKYLDAHARKGFSERIPFFRKFGAIHQARFLEMLVEYDGDISDVVEVSVLPVDVEECPELPAGSVRVNIESFNRVGDGIYIEPVIKRFASEFGLNVDDSSRDGDNYTWMLVPIVNVSMN